jgi:hypothetical protein
MVDEDERIVEDGGIAIKNKTKSRIEEKPVLPLEGSDTM